MKPKSADSFILWHVCSHNSLFEKCPTIIANLTEILDFFFFYFELMGKHALFYLQDLFGMLIPLTVLWKTFHQSTQFRPSCTWDSYPAPIINLSTCFVSVSPSITSISRQTQVRVVFSDKRLQYTEREQIQEWKKTHLGERVLDIDVPLSYGITSFNLSNEELNMIEFLWDPQETVQCYFKVRIQVCSHVWMRSSRVLVGMEKTRVAICVMHVHQRQEIQREIRELKWHLLSFPHFQNCI